MVHKYKTRLTTGKLKRKFISHDVNSDDGNSSESSYNDSEQDEDEDDGSNDDDNNKELEDYHYQTNNLDNKIQNKIKYYQFLNKIFPSNYSDSKVNKLKRQRLNIITKEINKKKIIEEESEEESEDEDLDDEDLDDEDLEDDDEDEDEDEDEKENRKKQAITILLQMLNNKNKSNNEEDEDEDDEDDDDDDDEDEDDDEDHEQEVKPEEYLGTRKKQNKKKSNTNMVIDDNEKNKKLLAKIANKNYKSFSKVLDEEDNESEYFKKELSESQQLNYIEKLKVVKGLTTIEEPYLIHLLNLDIPENYKACALRKIATLRSMGCSFGNSEYFKTKAWVDTFIKIPFNKYNNLPITFADGIDKCHDFMENAKNQLDKAVYGLEDAKIQIMQMIGLWLVNPNAVGSAIAIKGPPGTGKTTLIEEGISKILNRPYELIALGGCGDSGFLDGHDYTYEGSKYGKIIDILIKAGCMNPVILFDELDKLSDSFKGQEITGVLTHLTDSTQNTKFTDKYMSEISLDMSKALYIFSYNDESMVNPILKDRMYKIETKGYKTPEKLIIAKDYLLPKIRTLAKFEIGDITFDDEVLEYIINDFTEKECGVRNLKRCLEIIYTKLNLYRLMKPDINLFEKSDGFKLKEKIGFPCTITKEMIDKLINKGKKDEIPYGMYN